MNAIQDTGELDRRVRHQVFDAVMRTGRIARSDELAGELRCAPADVRLALNRLADAHMLALQTESGEILMAGPFSAVATPFPVKSGGTMYFGNCIWDAMGIPAMLQRDATIEASCACCATAMPLNVRSGQLQPTGGVVHFAVPAAHWWDNVVFT